MKRSIFVLFLVTFMMLVFPNIVLADTKTATLISNETGRFIAGNWKVESFLGFNTITKDDIAFPDGEKIIGREVSIASNYFSTESFAPDYEKYAVKFFGDINFIELGSMSGSEFCTLWAKVPRNVVKISDKDHVWVMQPRSANGSQSGPMLIDINHQRLLLSLNCDYFELKKNIWTKNDMDVAVYPPDSSEDGLYDVEYNDNDAERYPIDSRRICLLMVDGGFVPYPDIQFKNGQAFVSVETLSDAFGVDFIVFKEGGNITISGSDKHLALKIGSNDVSVVDISSTGSKTAKLNGIPYTGNNGVVYLPIRSIAELLSGNVQYVDRIGGDGNYDDIGVNKTAARISMITVELPQSINKAFTPEEGLAKVKQASAQAYQALLDYYKQDNRTFDDTSKDYNSQDIVYTGQTYGRYYVYQLKEFSQFDIYLNRYTGEIYSKKASICLLNIEKGFVNISWMYQ